MALSILPVRFSIPRSGLLSAIRIIPELRAIRIRAIVAMAKVRDSDIPLEISGD